MRDANAGFLPAHVIDKGIATAALLEGYWYRSSPIIWRRTWLSASAPVRVRRVVSQRWATGWAFAACGCGR